MTSGVHIRPLPEPAAASVEAAPFDEEIERRSFSPPT